MILRASGLSKHFGTAIAVNGVELALERGEIVGLTGPDGAGKTTLLRLLTGVLPADSGQVQLPAEGFGYMPQRFSLYGEMSVQENLLLMGRLNGVADNFAAERIERILTLTHLWAFRDRLADNLSGGMKQKLALAAGLMHRPQLFFLDEPTTGVDPVSRREFWQMLYQLNQEGMTVLVSTPYMEEAELCSRIAFLNCGEIVALGSPEELKASYPHHLLEVHAACKDLRRHLYGSFLLDLNSFGEKYHLTVAEPQAAAQAVRGQLAAAGIEILSLRAVRPTLEDVFVNLSAKGGAK